MPLNIDLTKFLSEIDHPAPIHFQRRANNWLKQLRTLSLRNGSPPIEVVDLPIDYFDVLRCEINVRNGLALSRLDIAQTILKRFPDKEIIIEGETADTSVAELAQLLPEGKQRIKAPSLLSGLFPKGRLFAYKARHELIHAVSPLSKKTKIPAPLEKRRLFVLPRGISHLRQISPVTTFLREKHGVQIVFGVMTNEVAELCQRIGCEYVNLVPLKHGSHLRQRARQELSNLSEFLAKLQPKDFKEEFTEAEIAAMKKMTRGVIKDNLLYSLHIIGGVSDVFQQYSPSLFFACNPYAMEGHAATYVAKKHSVPIASSEHGSIFPDDPIWQECRVDLVCVFGEPSRRALQACGLRDEQIAVTGAPRFDKIHDSFQRRNVNDEEASILVATSGPGDQVSFEQQQRFIDILYEASSIEPEVRWIVKLHSKDREGFYTKGAQKYPSARVEVVPSERARFGADIFDYLRVARGLVTICSTSALDAILVDVPVIVVALESKEMGLRGVEFLERGCALRVETPAELARAAQMVWRGIRDKRVDAAAREYRNEHYANLGNATEKVAEQLLRFMGEPEK